MPARRHPLEEQVRQVIANEPRWGPDRIYAFMEKTAGELGFPLDKLPSPRTIARIKARFPEDAQSEYRYVSWPETFEAGLLPWEASRVVLDLIKAWAAHSSRPTLRLTRWAWRLSLAGAVDWSTAQDLTAAEVLGIRRPDIETWLAFAPWRGEAEREEYKRMIEGVPPYQHAERVPAYDPAGPVSLPDGLTPQQLLEIVGAAGFADRGPGLQSWVESELWPIYRHSMGVEERNRQAEMTGEESDDGETP